MRSSVSPSVTVSRDSRLEKEPKGLKAKVLAQSTSLAGAGKAPICIFSGYNMAIPRFLAPSKAAAWVRRLDTSGKRISAKRDVFFHLGTLDLLWVDEILHHPRSPRMMIPLSIPTQNGFPWFQSGAGFVHPHYGRDTAKLVFV